METWWKMAFLLTSLPKGKHPPPPSLVVITTGGINAHLVHIDAFPKSVHPGADAAEKQLKSVTG
jgi:hypothetical protein